MATGEASVCRLSGVYPRWTLDRTILGTAMGNPDVRRSNLGVLKARDLCDAGVGQTKVQQVFQVKGPQGGSLRIDRLQLRGAQNATFRLESC